MEVNEEKRQKFMENAGKRVNNVMHDIQILEPMARSNAYDFTREDVEEMFTAMQGAFGASIAKPEVQVEPVVEVPQVEVEISAEEVNV